jgi:hypothetical protein
MSQRFEDHVEQLIRQAQDQGKFNDLANQGQPIKLEAENPYLDPDWRMAYKVAQDGGYVPTWIELDKEVEAEISKVNRTREDHRRWIARRLDDIKNGPTRNFVSDLRSLRQTHQRFLETHRKHLVQLNKKIDEFNAHCPVSNLAKAKVFVDTTIEAFDRTCPAIPEL